MIVSSGISAENSETAKNEILSQLDAIKRGDVTDEELESAKAVCIADTLAISDSQSALESFYLVRALEGTDYSPEESAELLKEVTANEVSEAAQATECDMIFLLAPSEDGDEDDEEEQPTGAEPEVSD